MRVRTFNVIAGATLALIFVASASEARADVVFTNFGAGQTYVGNSWWDVGGVPGTGTQVDAFSFVPTETATVTGADLALTLLAGSATPLAVYIESNSGGMPGTVLDTLTQAGSYSAYPTTDVVNFTCSASCSTLDDGTTYWLVGLMSDSANEAGWMYSGADSGTWYYNDTNSATGPWTVETTGDNFSAFDVTGNAALSAVPEPASVALLGSGLLGMLAVARRRAWKR